MTQTRTDGFVLTRVFDAPVELVWRCFTEQEHLAKWSAPRGYTITRARAMCASAANTAAACAQPTAPSFGSAALSRNRAAQASRDDARLG